MFTEVLAEELIEEGGRHGRRYTRNQDENIASSMDVALLNLFAKPINPYEFSESFKKLQTKFSNFKSLFVSN